MANIEGDFHVEPMGTFQMLKGKVAVITGSTSGIGLGIAEALAAARCSIVLNGLGDPKEIEAIRERLTKRHKVDVRYHAAILIKEPSARSGTSWGNRGCEPKIV
jgi:3-hydroxybutyrate dehydrogenase